MLALFRISALFIISPIFSRNNIPTTFKIGISFFLSLLVSQYIDIGFTENLTMISWVWLFIKELIIGYSIGFIVYLFFSAYYVAGQLMDMQIGFGMVNVFDPLSNAQVPILGNFFYLMTVLLLLIMNGHHKIIEVLIYSFKKIPVGTWIINESTIQELTNVFVNVFMIGIKISLPIVAALFITNVILGILARTVPQMNVFVVGMPAKILVGFLLLIVIIPVYFGQIDNFFQKMFETLGEWLR